MIETPGLFTQLMHREGLRPTEVLEFSFKNLYSELRQVARTVVRQKGSSAQATALVHQLFFKLRAQGELQFNDRAHFLAVCCKLMQRLMIDDFRKTSAEKRGGTAHDLSLDEMLTPAQLDQPVEEMLALHQALSDFEQEYPRQARAFVFSSLLELAHEEIAELLETSVATVKRDINFAKAWLNAKLS